MGIVSARGTGVLATGTATWANTANAFDGAVGSTPGTYATWTNATSSATSFIQIGGYFGAATLTSDSVVVSMTMVVQHLESSTTVISSRSVQLQDFAGNNIGVPVAVAGATVATGTTIAPTVLPTLAQVNSGLRLIYNLGHNASSTSGVASLDDIDMFITYQSAQSAGIVIPANPFVGPMALRNRKRMPYVAYRSAPTSTAYTDGANSAWVFSTSTDGHRGISDSANTSVVFTTSDNGFVDHPGAKTSIIIPNPFVGPMSLRNRKRMPYVASRKQGYTDGANTNIVFTTSDNGHRGISDSANSAWTFTTSDNGHRGIKDAANSTWTFATSDNGVRGVRDGANSTWVFATSDNGFRGVRDGANVTLTFTTADDGFVDHPGAKTSIIIPNPNVGPMALRHVKHMPYQGYLHQNVFQALSDGANSTWVFTTSTDGHRGIKDGANTTVVWVTSDDGFVDHPGAKTGVVIPNRFVGPQALRNSKRPPYVASQRQGYTDAANSAWVFSTSDNGHRGISDSANSTWIFTTSDNGFRGIRDGANTTIIWVTSDDGLSSAASVLGAKTGVLIPNPYVGPMGLRHLKRMPYQTYRRASFADAANLGWVFNTSDDGHRGIKDGASSVWAFGHVVNGIRGVRDGANLLITFSESDQGHVGRRDGANISIVIGHSDDGRVGRRDGAPLTIHFATSDDGNLNRFLIDVLPGNVVIVGPNETRTVTITPEALTQIIRAAGYIATVTDEQRTFTIPAGGAIQIV